MNAASLAGQGRVLGQYYVHCDVPTAAANLWSRRTLGSIRGEKVFRDLPFFVKST